MNEELLNTEAHITLRITLGVDTLEQDENPNEYYHYAKVFGTSVVHTEIPAPFLQACAEEGLNIEDVDIDQMIPEALQRVLADPQGHTNAGGEKQLRNSIAGDLWNEEQRAFEAQRNLNVAASMEYQYLSGVINGLTRARDIVNQEGPPPAATLEEREGAIEKALREPQ